MWYIIKWTGIIVALVVSTIFAYLGRTIGWVLELIIMFRKPNNPYRFISYKKWSHLDYVDRHNDNYFGYGNYKIFYYKSYFHWFFHKPYKTV
jgi:hypothetical protein